LLKAGPHFVPNQFQEEVVHVAVVDDRLSVVRLLYEAGWRLPDAMCGRALVHVAASIGMLEYLLFTVGCEACGYITDDGYIWSTLHKHCLSGTLEHVSLLIWAGADINARDSHGFTPMAYALHGVSLYPQLMCRYLERGIDRKQVCPTAQQRTWLRGMREDFQQVSTGPSLKRHSHH
jgi:hypothetical protein